MVLASMRRALQIAASVAGTAAVTLFSLHRANQTTVGFLFLLVVLAAATAFGFSEAVIASLAATAQFNFFFLPPVGTFTIEDPRNWVALATFLITATVASRLSTSARRRAFEAEQRRRETARLFELSRASLLLDPLQPVAAIERALVSIFGFADARIALAGQPPVSGDFQHRWALRVGQRQLGALHLAGTVPSPEGGEAIAGIVAIALERSRLLDEASRLQAVAASEAIKTALLDSVAHDLRTPLTSIKAAVTGLVEGEPNSARRELLAVIDEECDALNHIVQSLLDMARIESGALRPELRAHGLTAIIEDAIARARLDPARVALEAGGEMPPLQVDGALISQALAQLLANAAAYSPPERPIEITTQAGGGRLTLAVRDFGPGIAAADLPRVFEKFFRDPAARRNRPEGVGMGLAIARGIVEAHHGSITVTSPAGGGARFEIVLPLP